jgi:hypothetical protein
MERMVNLSRNGLSGDAKYGDQRHAKKYGFDLPIDVVAIKDFKRFIKKNPTHRLSYFDMTFIVQSNEELVINGSKRSFLHVKVTLG